MFTYSECKQFIEEPFELVSRITSTSLSDDDVKELTGYMKEFINDVDLEYSQQKKKDQELILLRGGM